MNLSNKDHYIKSKEMKAFEKKVKAKGKRMSREKLKKKRLFKLIVIPSSIIAVIAVLYLLFVFSSIPFIAYWRGIWIETAMTTGKHHWLAEAFIPSYIIDDVMSKQTINQDVLGGAEGLLKQDDETEAPPQVPVNDDILGQKGLKEGDLDYAGNTIVLNDIEEGIMVSEVSGNAFKGRIMLIDDPSRVFLGMTESPGVTGMRILDMMENYDAIAAINASGFNDPNENGNGGVVVGMSCSNGKQWGSYVNYYGSVVLTTTNKLVVGNISVWEDYNIRDGIQFGPVLIAEGEAQVSGSAGYGIQPRTAIGQREDGVIVFLIIDGRDVSYSIGCTVGDMAEILLDYNVINASCCDGGASSILAYKGEILTKNCSWNPSIGRLLPNAFMVRSKADS